jgi:hypothetical protein
MRSCAHTQRNSPNIYRSKNMFQIIALDKYEIRVLGPVFFPQLLGFPIKA